MPKILLQAGLGEGLSFPVFQSTTCGVGPPKWHLHEVWLHVSYSMVSTLDKSRPDPSYLIQQDRRSPQSEFHQLNLLALLEKSLEPALRIEAVPAELTVGKEPRFWLVHQPTGLRVPGQFSQSEAEYILKATSEGWDWEIEYRPRTPNCSYRLLCLLNRVCTPQKALEVAA